jgi:predicted transcriptional regulator
MREKNKSTNKNKSVAQGNGKKSAQILLSEWLSDALTTLAKRKKCSRSRIGELAIKQYILENAED